MATREEQELELQELQQKLRDLSSPDAAMCMPKRDRQIALKKAGDDYIDLMLELYHEVRLSVDGNQGSAVLGPNIQVGVAYFLPIGKRRPGESKAHAGRRAAMQAYGLLLGKLGRRPKDLPFVWQTK